MPTKLRMPPSNCSECVNQSTQVYEGLDRLDLINYAIHLLLTLNNNLDGTLEKIH